MSASHEIIPGACTIQSIRALDAHISTRGPEALRDALEFLLDALRNGRHITINTRGLQLSDFEPGQHVEMSPHTDRWMQGDRFGTVYSVGRKHVTIELERSGKTIAVHPSSIGRITV